MMCYNNSWIETPEGNLSNGLFTQAAFKVKDVIVSVAPERVVAFVEQVNATRIVANVTRIVEQANATPVVEQVVANVTPVVEQVVANVTPIVEQVVANVTPIVANATSVVANATSVVEQVVAVAWDNQVPIVTALVVCLLAYLVMALCTGPSRSRSNKLREIAALKKESTDASWAYLAEYTGRGDRAKLLRIDNDIRDISRRIQKAVEESKRLGC